MPHYRSINSTRSLRSRSDTESVQTFDPKGSSLPIGQYAEIISLIDGLTENADRLVTDSYVSSRISRLRSLFLLLEAKDKTSVINYLKSNVCGRLTSNLPGTVGKILCGCFLNNPNGQPARCTPNCISSPFGDAIGKPCDETVIRWSAGNQGEPLSTILQKGNCTCRVYVEPGFNASQAQREQFANNAGCETVFLYDAENNSPISAGGRPVRDNATSFVLPQPKRTIQPTTQPVPQSVATTSSDSGWIVWLFIILIIFIIIGIAIYINWVD